MVDWSMPKNAIVVGMPRSGTSLTAAIFARKGYYIGERELLRQGDDHNPFGYFEADDLIEANVEVLRKAGFEFHNTWLFEPISDGTVTRILELECREHHRRLVEEQNRRSPWMWKDPRLCYTLPYWWKLVDRDRTRVLLLRRDPGQIYHSFRRMGWRPAGRSARDDVMRRIEHHLGSAEAAIKALKIPYVRVQYMEYLQRPQAIARRLGEFFEVDLSVEDLNVRPDLNHGTLRGRISGLTRLFFTKLPRRPIRALERLFPRMLLAAVFSERRYTGPEAETGRPGKQESREIPPEKTIDNKLPPKSL